MDDIPEGLDEVFDLGNGIASTVAVERCERQQIRIGLRLDGQLVAVLCPISDLPWLVDAEDADDGPLAEEVQNEFDLLWGDE